MLTNQAVLEGCLGLLLTGWLATARDPRAEAMYGLYLRLTSVVCRERASERARERTHAGAEKGNCGNKGFRPGVGSNREGGRDCSVGVGFQACFVFRVSLGRPVPERSVFLLP